MATEFTDRYIRFTQILALILLPIVIFLFSFITLERKIMMNGIIFSPKQIIVRSAVKDTLVETLWIEAGDKVRSGQPLIQFMDVGGLAKQQSIAELRVRQIQDDIVLYSNANWDTLGKLAQKTELDGKIHSLRQEEIRLEELREKLALLTSAAPFGGDIVKLFVDEFSKLEVGTPLYEIAKAEGLYVKAFIPEKLFTLVKKGSRVYVKSNIYNYQWYQIFPGEVSYVSQFAQKDPDTGEIVFEVHILLLEGQDFLKVNTSVKCEVVRDRVGLVDYIFNTGNKNK